MKIDKQTSLRIAAFGLAPALFALSLAHLADTDIGKGIRNSLELNLTYDWRNRRGLGPGIDPRLKIYAYDNVTMAELGKPYLSLEEWYQVLHALSLSDPSAIVVDQIFSMPPGIEDADLFVERVSKIKTPIFVGGFTRSSPIRGRASLQRPPYPWKQAPSKQEPPTKRIAYGPHASLESAFRGIGSINYDGSGSVDLFTRIDNVTTMPHLGVTGSHDLSVAGSELIVDTEDGSYSLPRQAFVNFDQRSAYAKRTVRMLSLVNRARDAVPITGVKPGQIVLLLPAMFTGRSDFIETPVGTLPGGYLIAALISSTISGKWLWEFKHQTLTLIACTAVGVLIGVWLPPAFAIFSLISLLVVGILASLEAFARAGMILPWLYPSLAFLLSGGWCILEKIRRKLHQQDIDQALLDADLEIASRIQDSMLPAEDLTLLSRVRMRTFQQKFAQVGGDWIGFYQADEQNAFLALGDATGKGVQAALVVHAVQSLWAQATETDQFSPRSWLSEVNKTLIKLGRRHPHSMTLGILHMRQNRLIYWSAGHIPVHIRHDGQLKSLNARGSILGIGDSLQLESAQLKLSSTTDYQVLFSSDGLLPGGTSTSASRLHEMMNATRSDPARFMNDSSQNDDQTMVCIDYWSVA